MRDDPTKTCIAFQRHDHRKCRHQLLSSAKRLCARRNIRLTPRRQQVLEILLQSHQPMGAYDILSQLNQTDSRTALAPPIVYRALEFLLGEGLVHRIESRNAYIACGHPGHPGAAQFLICSDCDKVGELENSDTSFVAQAASQGFSVDHSVVEITGTCAGCQAHAV